MKARYSERKTEIQSESSIFRAKARYSERKFDIQSESLIFRAFGGDSERLIDISDVWFKLRAFGRYCGVLEQIAGVWSILQVKWCLTKRQSYISKKRLNLRFPLENRLFFRFARRARVVFVGFVQFVMTFFQKTHVRRFPVAEKGFAVDVFFGH